MLTIHIFLIILLINISRIDSLSQCLQQSPKYQEKYVKPILSALQHKGYTIHGGYFYWITNETKHGGNPASSYGMWNFPNISSSLKPSPGTPMAMLFHSSDAILFTGCTPPKATYFGFENYVYTKYNPSNNNNLSMSIVFGSTGAAINQYVINTTNINNNTISNNQDAFDPFGAMTTIITSGDKVTYNDIHKEYESRNLMDMVNDHWIPHQYFEFIPYNFTSSNYTVLTYPGAIDSFMPVARIMNYLNEEDWIEYTQSKQPVYWITAERLRPSNATQPRIPYTELYVRNHTSSTDELIYEDALNEYMDDVITYFEEEYKMQLVDQRQVVNYNIGPHYYGYNCYENNWNCQGDLRDEQYWGTHNGTNVVRRHPTLHGQGTYNLLNDSYFIMIGMNHVNTNMTVYDNVILYYMENRMLGLYEPIFMINNTKYNNSCLHSNISTSVNPEIVSKFYMVQIARPWHCDKYGANLPGICPQENIVSEHNAFAMYTRNLLNLETLTRPSQQQIIPDTLLHFRILTNK